jgi:hypothetical protein
MEGGPHDITPRAHWPIHTLTQVSGRRIGESRLLGTCLIPGIQSLLATTSPTSRGSVGSARWERPPARASRSLAPGRDLHELGHEGVPTGNDHARHHIISDAAMSYANWIKLARYCCEPGISPRLPSLFSLDIEPVALPSSQGWRDEMLPSSSGSSAGPSGSSSNRNTVRLVRRSRHPRAGHNMGKQFLDGIRMPMAAKSRMPGHYHGR